ncbi:MAG: hypothetical protein F4077_03870 [Gammaproteobacteria bacterium]|nr:hypothetical protein [Gammaproteobacteria bacterium]MYI76885.1 hypothetical protein [Gammaproteobacteria bacterium]
MTDDTHTRIGQLIVEREQLEASQSTLDLKLYKWAEALDNIKKKHYAGTFRSSADINRDVDMEYYLSKEQVGKCHDELAKIRQRIGQIKVELHELGVKK